MSDCINSVSLDALLNSGGLLNEAAEMLGRDYSPAELKQQVETDLSMIRLALEYHKK